MEKNLLVTVGDERSVLYPIRFLSNLFSNKQEIKLSLFYIIPQGPQVWAGEKDFESVANAEQQEKKNENKGRKALRAAKKELVSRGFAEDLIQQKLQPKRFSTAMDILQEGKDGLYDAVVLGSRGLSWVEQAFEQSVTKEVLAKKYDFPIWICQRPDLERKGILVCLDGSAASDRMVDHVGYILASESGHEVTLFSVANPAKNDKAGLEKTFNRAQEILIKHGFSDHRIKTKIEKSGQVAKAILNEADVGGYAAVAVGRTGAGQGLLGRIFIGSVSSKLFRELQKAALWLCY